MHTAAIEAEGLRKRYGDTHALAGLDLAVPAGTVCGLLGPNGAGKTTAVRILTTLLRPDGGAPAWPGTTCCATPTASAPRSAWSGSTPPSTRCSPGGRTSHCSAGCTTCPGGRPGPAPTSCSTGSA